MDRFLSHIFHLTFPIVRLTSFVSRLTVLALLLYSSVIAQTTGPVPFRTGLSTDSIYQYIRNASRGIHVGRYDTTWQKWFRDSSIWFISNARSMALNASGLLIGGATQDSQLTVQRGGHFLRGLKVDGSSSVRGGISVGQAGAIDGEIQFYHSGTSPYSWTLYVPTTAPTSNYSLTLPSNGGTLFTVNGGQMVTNAYWQAYDVKPATDNTYDLGTTSARWGVVYAGVGDFTSSQSLRLGKSGVNTARIDFYNSTNSNYIILLLGVASSIRSLTLPALSVDATLATIDGGQTFTNGTINWQNPIITHTTAPGNYSKGIVIADYLQTTYKLTADSLIALTWSESQYLKASNQIIAGGGYISFINNGYQNTLSAVTITGSRQWNFPNQSGTVALTSDIPTYAVTSVFGRTGDVVAATNDYTWAQINKATSSLADITTRSASDLTSGTLALARGGAGADLSGTGGSNMFVKQTTLGGAFSVGTISASELPTHTHAAGDITSGVLGAARGGTTLSLFTGANYLPYSTSSTALTMLAPPGSASVLTSSGGAPAWTVGYPASAWGSQTALGYIADALGVGGSIPVYYRTLTINGVTVNVVTWVP